MVDLGDLIKKHNKKKKVKKICSLSRFVRIFCSCHAENIKIPNKSTLFYPPYWIKSYFNLPHVEKKFCPCYAMKINTALFKLHYKCLREVEHYVIIITININNTDKSFTELAFHVHSSRYYFGSMILYQISHVRGHPEQKHDCCLSSLLTHERVVEKVLSLRSPPVHKCSSEHTCF